MCLRQARSTGQPQGSYSAAQRRRAPPATTHHGALEALLHCVVHAAVVQRGQHVLAAGLQLHGRRLGGFGLARVPSRLHGAHGGTMERSVCVHLCVCTALPSMTQSSQCGVRSWGHAPSSNPLPARRPSWLTPLPPPPRTRGLCVAVSPALCPIRAASPRHPPSGCVPLGGRYVVCPVRLARCPPLTLMYCSAMACTTSAMSSRNSCDAASAGGPARADGRGGTMSPGVSLGSGGVGGRRLMGSSISSATPSTTPAGGGGGGGGDCGGRWRGGGAGWKKHGVRVGAVECVAKRTCERKGCECVLKRMCERKGCTPARVGVGEWGMTGSDGGGGGVSARGRLSGHVLVSDRGTYPLRRARWTPPPAPPPRPPSPWLGPALRARASHPSPSGPQPPGLRARTHTQTNHTHGRKRAELPPAQTLHRAGPRLPRTRPCRRLEGMLMLRLLMPQPCAPRVARAPRCACQASGAPLARNGAPLPSPSPVPLPCPHVPLLCPHVPPPPQFPRSTRSSTDAMPPIK